MTAARTFLGTVRAFPGGPMFVPREPDLYSHRYCGLEERDVVETVKVKRPKRRLRANAYYHAVVVRVVGEEMEGENYDHDEVHEVLKRRCNGREVIKEISVPGKPTFMFSETVGQSTADFDTKEFSDYVQRCRAFSLNFLGTYVPEPRSPRAEAMLEEYMARGG